MQLVLDELVPLQQSPPPFKNQLLKWVGNKQRFAHEIISYFPKDYGCYFEPFVGSGAVLATLAPNEAIASDVNKPLVEIWQTLKDSPETLKDWYHARWHKMMQGEKIAEYERVKASFNRNPNGADLLFLSRTCYGGVVRFRQSDGYMSTPCGVHAPIPPEAFSRRVDTWHLRTAGTSFHLADYREVMRKAQRGDLIYCDPPYSHSQTILYKAQSFRLSALLEMIAVCKSNGVYVALSIDGTKRSGDLLDVPVPDGLFEREAFVNCGRSMLKRFQMEGKTLEGEIVSDRLLLTY